MKKFLMSSFGLSNILSYGTMMKPMKDMKRNNKAKITKRKGKIAIFGDGKKVFSEKRDVLLESLRGKFFRDSDNAKARFAVIEDAFIRKKVMYYLNRKECDLKRPLEEGLLRLRDFNFFGDKFYVVT
ncbi:MAG: hypothetical protein LBT51_01995 [Fusobacteriaceae bacterium]|jgi:hypothetical protein|nr:hypothetical protein [Fusobacteriaceae bacterium]